MSELWCHVGQVDITPGEAVRLDGFANRVGLSGAVHRPLTSRCLVLREGQERVCLIVNDLCELAGEHVATIKEAIEEATGLGPERVIIHCTHTHSAPAVGGMMPAASEAERRYRGRLCELVAGNAIGVLRDEEGYSRCGVRIGRAAATIGVNRRSVDPESGRTVIGQNAGGETDDEAAILQFTDERGAVIATVVNYACHPVTLGYESVAVSPDYPGRAREAIEEAFGGMAIFMNGGAGDINPAHGLQTDTSVTDREGEKLGAAVAGARLEPMGGDLRLVHGVRWAKLPYRDRAITAEWIDREVARKRVEVTEFRNWSEEVAAWGSEMKERLAAGEVKGDREVCLTAVRLGRAVLFFTQGETFVGYQLELKRAFGGWQVFFMSYSNGESGYLPTAEAFSQQGYEVDQAYVYLKEPSPLNGEAPRIFMDEATALIGSVCREVTSMEETLR